MDTQAVADEAAGLIDLTQLPLDKLWALGGDTVLDHSIRKVTAAAEDRPQQAVSAFNSAI